jgi:protein gp37
MAENTKIQWCHSTFNPWRGCSKVSPGCENCYAEALSKRNPAVLGEWGDGGTRVAASDAMWREPLRWDKAAKAAGVRHRVFCASLADVMEDRPELHLWRERLFRLIQQCHHLDWLLLTKRPENFARFLPWSFAGDAASRPGVVWPHVWLGTSVEDQARADERVPHLLRTPAAVRFLSVEPLLGEVNLRPYFAHSIHCAQAHPGGGPCACPRLHWVIVGGESGPGARPCDLAWVRSLVAQCRAAGVACFVKQLGAQACSTRMGDRYYCKFRDPKGGDPAEWGEDLRVREFPEVKP